MNDFPSLFVFDLLWSLIPAFLTYCPSHLDDHHREDDAPVEHEEQDQDCNARVPRPLQPRGVLRAQEQEEHAAVDHQDALVEDGQQVAQPVRVGLRGRVVHEHVGAHQGDEHALQVGEVLHAHDHEGEAHPSEHEVGVEHQGPQVLRVETEEQEAVSLVVVWKHSDLLEMV